MSNVTRDLSYVAPLQVRVQISKEFQGGIPLWIIILSILIGLLILALVIFCLWKVSGDAFAPSRAHVFLYRGEDSAIDLAVEK